MAGVSDHDSSSLHYLRAAGSSPGATAMAAAMRARAARQERALTKPKVIPVLYGSQTGNAMEIAKSISAEAQSREMPASAMAANDYSMEKLASASIAVFVFSSTGDGDPPDNCRKMFKLIHDTRHPPNLLANLQFTVLGLGDSNYTRYMNVPRTFQKRLSDLGAKQFYKFGEADEVAGLEEEVDDWMAGLWEALKNATKTVSRAPPNQQVSTAKPELEKISALQLSPSTLVGVPALQPCSITLKWKEGESTPTGSKLDDSSVPAKVTSASVLTAEWSDRKVIHLELESDNFLHMKAGDSIGITPINNENLVNRLIKRLGATDLDHKVFESFDGGQTVLPHIKQPCSLRDAFLYYCDTTSVLSKGFIRVLAESCTDEKEKHQMLLLCSRGGKDEYKTVVQDGRLGIVDFLDIFPSCRPPLEHILDHLRPLTCRYYSLSNSPSTEKGPGKVEVAFSVVRTKIQPEKESKEKHRVFEGVCTTWLERLLGLDSTRLKVSDSTNMIIPVIPKSGGPFRPPDSLESPLIMIGPGTGVSPFRGFLQHREYLMNKKNMDVEDIGRTKANGSHAVEGQSGIGTEADTPSCGEAWLFFGCRRNDEDYLYKEDLENFHKNQVLNHLVVAFSREQDTKVYVQDKIKDHGEEISSLLLNPSTFVYVCGDGANMAKDVHATLLFILEKHKKMEATSGTTHLDAMVKQGRYVRDIWS